MKVRIENTCHEGWTEICLDIPEEEVKIFSKIAEALNDEAEGDICAPRIIIITHENCEKPLES